MTWTVRLAEAEDYDAVRDLAKMNHAESAPHLEWAPDRMRETFFGSYLQDENCLIFVVTQNQTVVGFLLTGVYEYRAFVGQYTVQEVLFVRPEKRGSRAAAMLMKKLIEWSRDIGALEVLGGNDNDVHSDQTARFLSRFGFRSHGHAMRLDLHGRR